MRNDTLPRMNINRITLAFSDENEQKFLIKYLQNSIVQFRISFVLLIFLYGIFGYLDMIVAKEYVHLFHLIRYGIVIPLLSVVFFFSYIYDLFKPEVEIKGMKLSYKTGLEAKNALIKTDQEKIYAILINLVKNAIKYSNQGSIEFGYILKSDSEPGSTEHSRSAELEFFVKDTGIGISKDKQKVIFNRFVQADIDDRQALQGAGLGLSITKAYVEILGGKIWVDSEEGKGSVFYFSIPYIPRTIQEDKNDEIGSKNTLDENVKDLKILVAEDEDTSYKLINMYLNKMCRAIIHAKTGLQAIEACKNNPDIDLILMDIKMPEMNGYEATEQIRQFNKEVVIIAQTAYGLSGDREKAIEAGCNEYISKPISRAFLYKIINSYFRIAH